MKWNLDLAKKLYLRFSVIWGIKLTNQYPTVELIDMWAQDWYEGLVGVDISTMKSSIEYCRNNLEWPPSIAEFRKICEKSLNIPTPRECLDLAVRRDFTHPIVKTIFDKISTYDMKNGKEVDLLKRFEAHHKEYIADSRMKKLDNDECNRSKIVHRPTQGSVNDEGKQISRSATGGIHMRKAKDYLF